MKITYKKKLYSYHRIYFFTIHNFQDIILLMHTYVTSLCMKVHTYYISTILHKYLIVTYVSIAHSNSESRM